MVNYVVIGGGVAGVCCAEELCRTCPNDYVTLVSLDRILKVPPLLLIPAFKTFHLHIILYSSNKGVYCCRESAQLQKSLKQ